MRALRALRASLAMAGGQLPEIAAQNHGRGREKALYRARARQLNKRSMADHEDPTEGGQPPKEPPAGEGGDGFGADNPDARFPVQIEDEMRTSYLDYAMSVIIG